MSGHTEATAKKIAALLDADLIKAEPVKAYPDKGFKKFMWGGKSALMGDRPELLPDWSRITAIRNRQDSSWITVKTIVRAFT